MTTKGDGLFETFDPPPGGLAKLRERIDRGAHWRERIRPAQSLSTVAVFMALVSWIVVGLA